MQRSMMARGAYRTGRLHGLAIGIAPIAYLLLSVPAGAQIFSPGNLATAPLPGLPAGPPGKGGGGGGALGGLFDTLSVSGNLSEFYNTNATGGSGGSSDYDTHAGIMVQAASSTVHTSTQISYAGGIDYFAQNSQDVIFNNYLNASTIDEIIPDHLTFQATAFSNPVYVSQLGEVAPAGQVLPPGHNGDVRNTYGYTVSPDFSFRLGDFLRSDLLPAYSAVYYDTQAGAPPPPGGVSVADFYSTKTVTERISSGDYFERLQWGAIGSYAEEGQAAGGFTQRSVSGNLNYAIDHQISVTAMAGYESVASQLTLGRSLSGAFYMGGMQFNTERLTGNFMVGEQFHNFSVVGNLTYQITPRLTLSATAQDGVGAPGADVGALNPQQLIGAYIAALQSGRIQLPTSGGITLTGIQNAVAGLENSIARIQAQTVSLGYANNDYTFGLSGYNTVQDTQTAVPTGENAGLRSRGVYASVSHPLMRDMNGSLFADFHSDTLLVGSATGFDLQGRVDYSLNPSTQLYGSAGYFQRGSSTALTAVSPQSGDFSSISIGLGINHQFL